MSIISAAMAHYVYDELGLRTAATIHDGSPYANQLQQVFAEMFESLGGTITAQEAVNWGDTGMRPILTTIAVDSPEFLYYPIFISEGAQITMQAGEVAGLEYTVLAGADGMYSPDFIAAAGAACEGMYVSGPNLVFENPIYEHFLEVHQTEYGEKPLSVFHAHACDGTMMLLAAIEEVAVQDEDGTLHIGRQALRDALYGAKNFDGITGSLTCDQYGAAPTRRSRSTRSRTANTCHSGSTSHSKLPLILQARGTRTSSLIQKEAVVWSGRWPDLEGGKA